MSPERDERSRPDPITDRERLRRRNRELSVLNAIAAALNRSVDLDDALHAALDSVIALLDLETGWIWLLDPVSGDSYLAASRNLPAGLTAQPSIMEGGCLCLGAFRSGDMQGATNIELVTCSRLEKLEEGTEGYRFHATIPLHAQDRPLGVMNVATRDWRELTAEELSLLHTVSGLLGIAIERTRLFAESARLGTVDERNRLAREIHDTVAQTLTGIVIRLESADALLDDDGKGPAARQAVTRALDLSRKCLDDVRRSVLDLRAAPLEGRTLAEALTDLASEFGETAGVVTRLSVTGAARPLSPRVEIGLYRITQEALSNVEQHAGARHVELDLTATPDAIELRVADDGAGFDADRLPLDRFGIVGMNERARLLEGELRLASETGRGTEVWVRVPLSEGSAGSDVPPDGEEARRE